MSDVKEIVKDSQGVNLDGYDLPAHVRTAFDARAEGATVREAAALVGFTRMWFWTMEKKYPEAYAIVAEAHNKAEVERAKELIAEACNHELTEPRHMLDAAKIILQRESVGGFGRQEHHITGGLDFRASLGAMNRKEVE